MVCGVLWVGMVCGGWWLVGGGCWVVGLGWWMVEEDEEERQHGSHVQCAPCIIQRRPT